MIILVMKLAQEETMARYDGCCNHQLLHGKKTQKNHSPQNQTFPIL